ncbi:MAG: hypothetical protein WDW36_004088 [Sanguina aurantia]
MKSEPTQPSARAAGSGSHQKSGHNNKSRKSGGGGGGGGASNHGKSGAVRTPATEPRAASLASLKTRPPYTDSFLRGALERGGSSCSELSMLLTELATREREVVMEAMLLVEDPTEAAALQHLLDKGSALDQSLLDARTELFNLGCS